MASSETERLVVFAISWKAIANELQANSELDYMINKKRYLLSFYISKHQGSCKRHKQI